MFNANGENTSRLEYQKVNFESLTGDLIKKIFMMHDMFCLLDIRMI